MARTVPIGVRRFPVVVAIAISFLVGAAGALAAEPAPPRYAIVELSGVPYRLNDSGEIAGWIFVGTDAHAAVYRDGAWTDLGVPAGDQLSAAFGISNAGAVVGYSFFTNYLPPPNTPNNVNNRWRAISAPAPATSVGVLAAVDSDSFAYAINDSDWIVGCRNRDDDIYPDPHRAFLYSNGVLTDLHGLLSPPPDEAPFNFSCARDINNTGAVVGEVALANQPQRGFLYQDGQMTLLDRGATPYPPYLTNGRAINASGKVVGEGRLAGFTSEHALVFDVATSEITSLGLETTGASSSRPNDINSHGDVVGAMQFGASPDPIVHRAFLATAGRVFNLNDLVQCGSGWVLEEAHSINAQGWIVGRGHLASEPATTRYFLLTPSELPTVPLGGPHSVDEEGSLALAGAFGDDPSAFDYAWTVVDGSGAIVADGPEAVFSAQGIDGTATSSGTVCLRVSEAGELVATGKSVVAISNVAPTASLSANPSPAYPGEVVTLALSEVADPSPADVAAGLTVAFACSGGDSLDEPSPADSHHCSYAVAGPQVARARVTDKDGGSSEYAVTVAVLSHESGAAGLIQAVRALAASGLLNGGNANALITKLEGAIAQLERGNVGPAVNKIEAFINQVQAFVGTGKLTIDVGQPLLDEAHRIIDSLTS